MTILPIYYQITSSLSFFIAITLPFKGNLIVVEKKGEGVGGVTYSAAIRDRFLKTFSVCSTDQTNGLI